ncbi:PREDICTED: interleukin-6 [Hipposideros armiger]|uniref:Interleukin-6 n=1 Tax=Hipposideros armiger TaxID=186990 RepID=A0A8B7S4P4_HIPAR|nr:PREDICTED: interleukin-6 [Hipposideros armiger]
MNSLSTSSFSPVAFSLGLLLVMATAFPAPVPRGEDSKDDTTSKRPPLASTNQTESLIKSILSEISEVKNKICGNDDMCENRPTLLQENKLNLPKMLEKDGCFHSGFNQETCLMRITTGLLEFQIYLEYLQSKFEENAKAMQMRTKALVLILKQKVKNPDEVTTPNPITNSSLLAEMQSQSGWLENTTIHLILRSLEDFLEFSQRAVRIM